MCLEVCSFLMEDRGWGGTWGEARGRGKGKEQLPLGLAVIEERKKINIFKYRKQIEEDLYEYFSHLRKLYNSDF